MAKKKPEAPPPEPATFDELGGHPHDDLPADGPVHVDPIPPPPAPAPEQKRKRGRPPGSGKKPSPAAVDVLSLDDLKRELAQASALAVAFTRAPESETEPNGTIGKLADSLGWHKLVEVVDKGRTVHAIAPSDRLEKATALMGPYLSESGALQLVQLGPEAKFAIGLGVLIGPALLTGFGALWGWAMYPKKAAAQVVPIPAQRKEA